MSDALPPTPPPPEPLPPLPPEGPRSADNQWAIGIHLSALLGVFGCSIPGINVIGPLVIWLLKRPESAHIDAVGKRVLNFQMSWAIYFLVGWAVVGLLWIVLIGILLLPVMLIGFVAWIVITIIGAIKESNGEPYRFPLTIEFLK